MDVVDIQMEFMNGSCSSLARVFNQIYGHKIHHVFQFNMDDDYDDSDDGVMHFAMNGCS